MIFPSSSTTGLNKYAAALQSYETLDLPGMELVDSDPSNLQGQVVYLEFDGEMDPLFSIRENLTAKRVSMITVPIHVDAAADLFLADIDLQYDTNVFDLSNGGINLGDLTTGWNLTSNFDDSEGRVMLSTYSTTALKGGFGSIIELEFNVRSDAALGITVIDLLESCSLNEGALVLTLQDGEVMIQDNTAIPTLLAWKRNDSTESLKAFHNRFVLTHRLHFRNFLVYRITDDSLREKAISAIATLLAKSGNYNLTWKYAQKAYY